MRRGRGYVIVAALLVQAACASVPPAPVRDDVAQGISGRAEALAPTAVREFTMPPGVSAHDGLSMDEAVATALWNNPDFQAALAGLGVARADLIQAGMIRNPVLSMLFPWGPKQFEATVNLPIDAIWQRPRRIADAKLNAQAIADRLIAAGLQLVGDVKTQFIDVIASEQALAIAAERAGIARQLKELAAGRLRAGDISELDARLAGADAARFEAARVQRVRARDLAMNELLRLIGVPAGTAPLTLADPASAPTPGCGDQAALLQTALASRPDVRAAEIDVEAAAARAGVERSRIATLTAILDANGQGKEGFEAGPGLAAEVPIFSRNDGGRARAAAELEQAGRRYLAVRARVSADVQAAFIRFNQALAATEVWSGDAGMALTTGRLQAQQLYDAGEISLLDLLDTRRRLSDSESMAVDARSASRRELVRLEQAVGRSCRTQ